MCGLAKIQLNRELAGSHELPSELQTRFTYVTGLQKDNRQILVQTGIRGKGESDLCNLAMSKIKT